LGKPTKDYTMRIPSHKEIFQRYCDEGYSDNTAMEKTQEYFEGLGDYLHDQEKDRRMEES
jgi:hypothetical protein